MSQCDEVICPKWIHTECNSRHFLRAAVVYCILKKGCGLECSKILLMDEVGWMVRQSTKPEGNIMVTVTLGKVRWIRQKLCVSLLNWHYSSILKHNQTCLNNFQRHHPKASITGIEPCCSACLVQINMSYSCPGIIQCLVYAVLFI